MDDDSYVDCLKKIVFHGFNPQLNKLEKEIEHKNKRIEILENYLIVDRSNIHLYCDFCKNHCPTPLHTIAYKVITILYCCDVCHSYVLYDFCNMDCFKKAIADRNHPISLVKECMACKLNIGFEGNNIQTCKLIRVVHPSPNITYIDHEYDDLTVGNLYTVLEIESLNLE